MKYDIRYFHLKTMFCINSGTIPVLTVTLLSLHMRGTSVGSSIQQKVIPHQQRNLPVHWGVQQVQTTVAFQDTTHTLTTAKQHLASFGSSLHFTHLSNTVKRKQIV